MIVETVLNFIILLILGIISLFPAFPTLNLDFLNGVVRVFSLADMFVSLRVVSGCLVVILFVWNARVIWSGIMWVARKLPFVN